MTLVSVCVHFLKLLDTKTQKWTQSLTKLIDDFICSSLLSFLQYLEILKLQFNVYFSPGVQRKWMIEVIIYGVRVIGDFVVLVVQFLLMTEKVHLWFLTTKEKVSDFSLSFKILTNLMIREYLHLTL